jgi:hypothetical protein
VHAADPEIAWYIPVMHDEHAVDPAVAMKLPGLQLAQLDEAVVAW